MKFHGRFEFARLIPPMQDHRGKRGGKYSEKIPSKSRGNPSVKNTRKREVEADEIKKHNLRKGV